MTTRPWCRPTAWRRAATIAAAAALLLTACGAFLRGPRANGAGPEGTTAAPAGSGAIEMCRIVIGGRIGGTVTHAGALTPDGTIISIVFEGGPLQEAETKSGHYTLPTLARRCTSGLRWVPFTIWAGGSARGVTPDGPDMQVNLEAPNPPNVRGGTGLCQVIVGVVSGRVEAGGRPAADGTPVLAKVGPGLESLAQATVVSHGRYAVSSVGTRCADGAERFLSVTLSALGMRVEVTPTTEDAVQDIGR